MDTSNARRRPVDPTSAEATANAPGRCTPRPPSAAAGQWFVEEFHLRSPYEEFKEFSLSEMERRRSEDPKFDDTTHREAIELVLHKLQPGRTGGKR